MIASDMLIVPLLGYPSSTVPSIVLLTDRSHDLPLSPYLLPSDRANPRNVMNRSWHGLSLDLHLLDALDES